MFFAVTGTGYACDSESDGEREEGCHGYTSETGFANYFWILGMGERLNFAVPPSVLIFYSSPHTNSNKAINKT